MGLRHGVFHAMDLRNAQALDVARPAECCLSLELCNAVARAARFAEQL
jgi:hypothetical protein